MPLSLATFDRRDPPIGAVSIKLGELPAVIEARPRGKPRAPPVHPLRHWRTHALRRSTNLCTAGCVSPLGCQSVCLMGACAALSTRLRFAVREDASTSEVEREKLVREEEGGAEPADADSSPRDI